MSSQFTPVRHHYEDMPPYNYMGIEDQIDASYDAGSCWNLQDANTTTTTTTDSARTTAEEVCYD